jgi:hypothetical protein
VSYNYITKIFVYNKLIRIHPLFPLLEKSTFRKSGAKQLLGKVAQKITSCLEKLEQK